MTEVDEATIVAWPPNHAELASAFRAWAGTDTELRVYFTPDVLIGLNTRTRRGYLYDDGTTVEVWVERGLDDFFDLLPSNYLAEHCQVERPPDDPSPQRGLLDLALSKGSPIAEVRHLI